MAEGFQPQEQGTAAPVWRCILVPMDFSAPSEEALIYALYLASN